MAEETKEKEQNAEESKEAKTGGPRSYLPWIIMVAVVAICAGGGFGLGRLLAGGKAPRTAEVNEPQKPEYQHVLNEQANSEKMWFYKCDPVVANLNEPGATRYVSMGFTLEVSGQLPSGGGAGRGGGASNYLKEKQPLITNWVTIYLSSLSLADVQGEKNLNRILQEIRDGLNAKLFPEAKKPLIVSAYYYQNAIQ